jgi:hypothetical protein
MQKPCPLSWWLDASEKILLSNKFTVTKPQEVNAGCNLAESSKEGHKSKRAVLLLLVMMMMMLMTMIMTKKTPWSESASELYRLSDRRLSAK